MTEGVTTANVGKVEPTATGFVLRFERELDHPVETVWHAITVEHADWLAGPGSTMDLRVGGKVWMPAHEIESTIVELDPPRVLAFGWDSGQWGDGGTVRFELIPRGDGTRLVFTHDHPPIDPKQQAEFAAKMGWPDSMQRAVPRTLAGWHALLDRLERRLDGAANAAMPTADEPGAEWEPLFAYYLDAVSYDGVAR